MFGKNKELGVTNPAGLFFLLLLFFFFALLLGCGKRSLILRARATLGYLAKSIVT